MNYLRPGETLRSRMDECLQIGRETGDPVARANYLREAGVLAKLIEVDTLDAYHSAQLATPIEASFVGNGEVSYFYDDDDIRDALDGGGYGDADILIERLKRIVEARLRAANGLPPYTHTPDRIVELMVDPRFVDSADIPGAGEGPTPTPRLPAEQFPTSDEDPDVDFDVDLGALPSPFGHEVEDAVEAHPDLVETDDDEDDLDFIDDPEEMTVGIADPAPVSEQAPETKPSAFKAAKKKTTKKETRK